MARTVVFNKEEILKCGLEFVKCYGIKALNARKLAETLNMTTTPIFTNFGSMENFVYEIWNAAKKECYSYILETSDSSATDNLGMRFVRLAYKFPHLFNFVFLNSDYVEDHRTESFTKLKDDFLPVYEMVMKKYLLTEAQARELVHFMMIFAVGTAVSIIDKKSDTDEQYVNSLLSTASDAIAEYIKKNGVNYESD